MKYLEIRIMETKYATAKELKETFNFIIEDYNFKIIKEESLNYGSYVDFIGNGIKLSLGFDFKDYYFYFLIYKGENTKYSDDAYGKEIITFCDLALKYNIQFDCECLQPNTIDGYKNALTCNAQLLKDYGENILSGKVWF
jgi:hypothetical protein